MPKTTPIKKSTEPSAMSIKTNTLYSPLSHAGKHFFVNGSSQAVTEEKHASV